MNFFVTGDGSVKANVDLSLVMPAGGSHGANFAGDGQSLRQSLSIARNVFSRVARGKIDFVLIGLAPEVLFIGGTVDENFDALTEYLKLCVDNVAKPVFVILPVESGVHDRYREKFVTPLREILSALKNLCDFELVDLFDLTMPEDYFSDGNLNSLSVRTFNAILGFELYNRRVLPFADLQRVSYRFFFDLSFGAPAEFFHGVMHNVFRTTIAELKRKDKIKIAFVADHAAVWCGDELYNMFAGNPRFEPTIFLCLPNSDDSTPDLAIKETIRGIEEFKSRGLNVVGIFDENEEPDPQDVMIFLRPYDEFFPKNFRPVTLTPQTLLAYIHYSYQITTSSFYHNYPLFRLAWKFFVDSELTRKFFDERCTIGMPRAYASGLPKLDVFFDVKKFSFPWKITRSDAKKIIWAPHWTVFNEVTPNAFGTFQHNFRFMYKFAKSHPETSWVVKPHPLLASNALQEGLFASVKDFEDYVQAWNDLPNACFVTGAYYQDIFATSDGMIQDSGSFIAEYQYTHKPMIYLMREEQNFNEAGRKILDVSYCVDGRDFDGIAALIQKVFIDGDDPLKNARQKVFDELLNYRLVNGMSASEYIFHSIADELTSN